MPFSNFHSHPSGRTRCKSCLYFTHLFFVLLLLALSEAYLSRHAQRQPHLYHQKYDGGTSIADKREGDAGRRNRIRDNRNIQHYLQCYMYENARCNQRSEQIRRILCNHSKTVQHKYKQQDDNRRTEYAKLLADDRENHIILRLRNCPELLCAVAKPLAEKAPGTNRVQCLQNLITVIPGLCLRMQPCLNTLDTEASAVSGHIDQHNK